ncbi:ATP-binding protein [Brachyspira pilosicoli]|uniref:YifB family Mg chelatase-like AAA ATPase n=2 Tax=Brachyspira pilosicoli TaxID=52584 RepID=A0AAJ6G7X9_BRAPL|nr:YifB family Mg chelatase-like AAA ATPase [Brachyspira pilosicoli]AGA66917.1 putative ATPase with chaperone activity [Brachyspira pilosicoli P43/6/78]MBW5378353.1 ATP-binding protein [Brachyspira pilosicoli]MBW5393143.1 ATP-binding protein [Brachyspira pilosicoli]WIH85158.1 YifB family Mg chelatase-like AAA ATPase [Brachyspira pilosicoli]WIH89694.1 YifB family Mg chelatase-like AAA ATPase [Brachyspira pilosicoli]
MHTKIYSEALYGIEGIPITIEVNISEGLPKFDVVGLPDQAVNEAKERVIAAINNSDRFFPPKRITINLAPADIKKSGSMYDLAFALGILSSSAQLFFSDFMNNTIILGELALDGSVREVKGIFSMLLNAKELGIKNAIIPFNNMEEANIIEGLNLYPVKTLKEAMEVSEGKKEAIISKGNFNFTSDNNEAVDFSEVKGQEYAKRAAMIAAAGGHNFIMIGSPGCGKTLIAKRIPTILPPLTFEEAIEVTKIYSSYGLLSKNMPIVKKRPFRIPHHTSSHVSLVGGGRNIKAGEITLAHNGVLFLDEFVEFQSSALQTLREPMEEKTITISRANGSISFPANFTLVAAMNPCPCGYYGDEKHTCRCSEMARKKYIAKLSGPILDRIDISIEVRGIDYDKMISKADGETSSSMRKIVTDARKIQEKRFRENGLKIFSNSSMGIKDIEKFCILDSKAKNILNMAMQKFSMSARSYNKILKVSRTIADIENKEVIETSHITEALQYRFNLN